MVGIMSVFVMFILCLVPFLLSFIVDTFVDTANPQHKLHENSSATLRVILLKENERQKTKKYLDTSSLRRV